MSEKHMATSLNSFRLLKKFFLHSSRLLTNILSMKRLICSNVWLSRSVCLRSELFGWMTKDSGTQTEVSAVSSTELSVLTRADCVFRAMYIPESSSSSALSRLLKTVLQVFPSAAQRAVPTLIPLASQTLRS